MDVYDKIPTWLKVAVGAGILLMGPIILGTFWFGGANRGIFAIVVVMVYFMTLYIVGIRRYVEDG